MMRIFLSRRGMISPLSAASKRWGERTLESSFTDREVASSQRMIFGVSFMPSSLLLLLLLGALPPMEVAPLPQADPTLEVQLKALEMEPLLTLVVHLDEREQLYSGLKRLAGPLLDGIPKPQELLEQLKLKDVWDLLDLKRPLLIGLGAPNSQSLEEQFNALMNPELFSGFLSVALIPTSKPLKLNDRLVPILGRGAKPISVKGRPELKAWSMRDEYRLVLIPEEGRLRILVENFPSIKAEPWVLPSAQVPKLQSPAALALLSGDYSLAAHLRGDKISQMGLVTGALQGRWALRHVSPEMRAMMSARMISILLRAVIVMDDSAPDFEDHSFLLKGGEAGFQLRQVSSLNAASAPLFQEALQRTLPSLGVKAQEEALAWGSAQLDLSLLLDKGPSPAWLRPGVELQELTRSFSECGVWCLQHTLFRAPLGLLRWLKQEAVRQGRSLPIPGAMAWSLVAVHPHLKLAVALKLPKGSQTDILQALIEAQAARQGEQLIQRVLPHGDHELHLWGLGVDPEPLFEFQASLSEPFKLQVNGAMLKTKLPPALGLLFRGLKDLSWRAHLSGAALINELKIGGERGILTPWAPLNFESLSEGLPNESGGGRCLRIAALDLLKLFELLDSAPPEQRSPLMMQGLNQLNIKCIESSEQRSAMALRGFLVLKFAEVLQGFDDLQGALKLLEQECVAHRAAQVCAQRDKLKAMPTPKASKVEKPLGLKQIPKPLKLEQIPKPLELKDNPDFLEREESPDSPEKEEKQSSKISLKPPTTRSSLSKQQIQRVIRKQLSHFRFCYEQGLMTNPALHGKLSLKLEIAAKGELSKAEAAGSSLEPKVTECILKAAREMRFPETGTLTKVSYPLIFKTEE